MLQSLCLKLGLMRGLVLSLLLTQVMGLMKKLLKIARDISHSLPVSCSHENPTIATNSTSKHTADQSSCSSDEEGLDNMDRDVNTQVNVSVFPNRKCTCKSCTKS